MKKNRIHSNGNLASGSTISVSAQRGTSPRTILAIVSLSHAVNHLNGTAITVLISLVIAAEFGLSNTQVGLVAAATSFTAGFLQIAFSVLGRHYAMKLVLALANALMGFASAIAGFATNFYGLVTARMIWGIGSAAQHPVGASMISNHFEGKLRGRALGTHSSIAYLGNVAGPPLAFGIAAFVGWRGTLFVLAALTISMALPLILGIDEVSSVDRDHDFDQVDTRKSIMQAIKDRNIMLITLTQTVLVGGRGLGVQLVFIPILLTTEIGLDNATVGYFYVPIFLLGGFLGPLLYGWLSDRWGRKAVTTLVIILVGIFTYTLPLLRGPVILGAALFALGSFSLSITSLLQVYLAEVTNPAIRDIAFGLYFTMAFGFASVWLILIGLAIDLYGFATAFKLIAAFTIPAAILCLLVSPPKKQSRVIV